MARGINLLSARTVDTLPPRKHPYADGAGLYLSVGAGGARSWLFIYARAGDGKRVEVGLGSTRDITLKRAREIALSYRLLRAEGEDPLTAKRRKSVSAIPTFGEAADKYIETHRPDWRNAKHAAQWSMTLTTYAGPIRNISIDKIETSDVLRVLQPIWRTKPDTANRLRGRIEAVLDAAAAAGHRSGDNPARYRGHLQNLLGKKTKLTRGHHAALPFAEVPAFMKELRAVAGTSARALEFTILTAARTNEVIGATWDEVDLERAIWTVPPDRMKAKREHRVPLPAAAVAVLRSLRSGEPAAKAYVFAGPKKGSCLSNMAMAMLLRRLDKDFTVHGFRSSFRDWAGEATDFPRELAEQALAHVVGDETERAYRRGDALERRRELMEAWAKHCSSLAPRGEG